MSFSMESIRLRRRWIGEELRVSAIIADLRAGVDWRPRLGADPTGRWRALPLVPKTTSAGNVTVVKDLRGIRLLGCDLANTSGLSDARLDYAVIDGVSFDGASLVNCNFSYAVIGKYSSFCGADLRFARFWITRVHQASFDRARLEEVDLSGAEFIDVSFRGALLRKIELTRESALWPGGRTRMGGDDVAGRVLHSDSDASFCRFMDGEGDIWALRHERPLVARIWYILTNYGRSAGRLLAWVVMVWLFFGWLYAGLPVPKRFESRAFSVARTAARPSIITSSGRPLRGFAPFYFSAVTLTTLGYGDVSPALDDWKSQAMVVTEATFGLIAWSALVAILLQTLQQRRQ